ncbi:hypothetical protein Tco_0632781 [Tanacetum coccineum]
MPPRRGTRTRTAPATATTTTLMTDGAIRALIARGVADALAEQEIQRNTNLNGDGSQGSGSGITRPVRPTREYTYSDFLKFQPLNFKGTEGVVGLTQWFERMETVFHISKYAVEPRFPLPPSIQENFNQQKMYELLQMMQSFCEKLLQQKQAASVDQSPLQEMSIQDMENLKQHYLDEMLSLSNNLQIKDYRNEKIDIRFRRECESMINELKGKFNGMSIEINKKKELQHLEQVANLSTYPSRRFNSFYDDDDYEESTIPLNEIISQLPQSIAITPVLPTMEPEDSLIMGNEELSIIPEKKSDEFIKSSVEDLIPIPSESEDTFESDNDCDLSVCDDFFPINVYEEKSVTFSNPLFDSNDDFTFSFTESILAFTELFVELQTACKYPVSPFVIVLTLWSLLLGPGALPHWLLRRVLNQGLRMIDWRAVTIKANWKDEDVRLYAPENLLLQAINRGVLSQHESDI